MSQTQGNEAVVSRPVVFTFDTPDDPASVQTQLRHGAVVWDLERREADGKTWARVRYGWGLTSHHDEAGCNDEGWLDAAALVAAADNSTAQRYAKRGEAQREGTWLQVVSLAAQGFAKPSRTAGPSVVVLPAESWLLGEEMTAVQAAPGAYGSRWWRVALPGTVAGVAEVFFQEGDLAAGGLPRLDKGAGLAEVQRTIGRPYVWGGASSFGLDCSGLVQMSARRRGVALPHSARRQFTQTDTFAGLESAGEDLAVQDVAGEVRSDGGRGDACSALGGEFAARARKRWADTLRPGDIVYFAMGGKRVDHVGLFVGEDRMLHASSSHTPHVRTETLWGSVYAARMVGVRRLVPAPGSFPGNCPGN